MKNKCFFQTVLHPSALPSRCTLMERIFRRVLPSDWLALPLILVQTCSDVFQYIPVFPSFCVVLLFFQADLGFCGYFYLFQDENDNPPKFSKSSYIVKIPENINAGENLTMICGFFCLFVCLFVSRVFLFLVFLFFLCFLRPLLTSSFIFCIMF